MKTNTDNGVSGEINTTGSPLHRENRENGQNNIKENTGETYVTLNAKVVN